MINLALCEALQASGTQERKADNFPLESRAFPAGKRWVLYVFHTFYNVGPPFSNSLSWFVSPITVVYYTQIYNYS